ncbi:hypothetical protein REPUB_Repub03eG0217000 [Reevesia pubescens]
MSSLSLGSKGITGAGLRSSLSNPLLGHLRWFHYLQCSAFIYRVKLRNTTPHKAPQPDPQQGSNFTLQLFQPLICGIVGQMEMSRVMSSILENQAELMEEAWRTWDFDSKQLSAINFSFQDK